MKKIIFLLLSLCYPFFANAQNDTLKITGGAVVAFFGSNNFDLNKEKPFLGGCNIYPNICIVTPKTYHNFLYGALNNTVKNVNGMFLNKKKNFCAYISETEYLASGGGSLSVGIEGIKKAGDVNLFIFSEIQRNINIVSAKKFLWNIGVHANLQFTLFVKK
jgi:hypothetical protein